MPTYCMYVCMYRVRLVSRSVVGRGCESSHGKQTPGRKEPLRRQEDPHTHPQPLALLDRRRIRVRSYHTHKERRIENLSHDIPVSRSSSAVDESWWWSSSSENRRHDGNRPDGVSAPSTAAAVRVTTRTDDEESSSAVVDEAFRVSIRRDPILPDDGVLPCVPSSDASTSVLVVVSRRRSRSPLLHLPTTGTGQVRTLGR